MNLDGSLPKRLFTATALLISAGAFLVSDLIREPSLDGPGSAVIGVVSAHVMGLRNGTWANIVYAIATTLFLVGLVAIARGRGSAFVFAGAAIALVGNLAHSAVVVIQIFAANLPAGEAAQMAGLWDRFNNDPQTIPIVAMIILFPIGTTLVIFGLVRAGVIHWSLFALGIVVGLVDFAHFPYSHDVLALGSAIVSVAVSFALLFPQGIRQRRHVVSAAHA